jgi:hypothetical protein
MRLHLAFDSLYPSSSKCTAWNQTRKLLQTRQSEFLSTLRDSIPCHFLSHKGSITCSSNQRQKRSLFFSLLGLASGGLSLYNLYAQQKIQHAVSLLQSQHDALNSEIRSIKDVQLQQTKLINNVIVSVKHAISDIRSDLIKEFCEWYNHTRQIVSFLNFALAERITLSIFEHILTNRLTHDILDSTHALHIIRSHPLLTQTTFNSDLGLFYTLTKTYFISFDPDESNLNLMLQIPLIHAYDLLPLYSITNLGFLLNSTHVSFDLPSQVYFSNDHFIETSSEHCRWLSFLTICEPKTQVFTHKSKCATSLLIHNNTSPCHLNTRTSNTPYIFAYSPTGLFLSSLQSFHIIQQVTNSLSKSTLHGPTQNSSIFFHYEDFDTIIIGDTTLPSRLAINYTTSFHPINFDITEIKFSVPHNWSRLMNDVENLMTKQSQTSLSFLPTIHSHPIISIPYIFLAISLLLFIVNLYFLRQFHARLQSLEQR